MKLKWSTDDTREENIIARQGRRIAELEQELAALREAVAWERECDAVSRHDIIRRLYALYLKHGQEYTDSVLDEFAEIGRAARAEVDRLMGDGE